MSPILLLVLVGYISFSLGIIIGCLIMTRDDREPNPKNNSIHSTKDKNTEDISPSDNLGEMVGK